MIVTGRNSPGVSQQTQPHPGQTPSERPQPHPGVPEGGLTSHTLVMGLGPHILETVVSLDPQPVGQVKCGTLWISPFYACEAKHCYLCYSCL